MSTLGMDRSAYLDWNSLLLSEFFPPSSAGEDVWIGATRAELDSLGIHLGGAEGLIDAARVGAPWASHSQHCADAAAELARQRVAAVRPKLYVDPGTLLPEYAGLKAPAYLPYLALWVLASSEAEDGFYAHVNALLGLEPHWSQRRLDGMAGAWADLERWSAGEAGRRFGHFVMRILGEHRFVGIPRSQCLMSARDHVAICRLFYSVGLRPGQELTGTLFTQLAAEGAESPFLSNGLRRALRSNAYREPLVRLFKTRLDAWDGKLPGGSGTAKKGSDAQDDTAACAEATLALVPSPELGVDWGIRWRVPAIVYSGTIKLKTAVGVWTGYLERLGTHASTLLEQEPAAIQVLAQSENEPVAMSVTYVDDAEENGGLTRRFELRRKMRRVLAWDNPDPSKGVELVERDLPINGPAYLLLSPTSWGSTKPFLERQGIVYEPCDTGGLPVGWKLICVPACEKLDWGQRDWLCDGEASGPALARIRLIGGRSITRGGTRRYAFYDLPVAELEAAEGVELVADGLLLEKVDAIDARVLARTYRIGRTDQQRALFELRAVLGNQVLARCTLRVTAAAGTAIADTAAFGIDQLGRPAGDGALRGILKGTSRGLPASSFEFAVATGVDLGPAVDRDRGIEALLDSPAAKFLDTLAQVGSMSYGVAREQLARLSAGAVASPSATLALLELRARAHVELETDHKGHLTRVHPVPFTLYTLPARHDGLALVAVCGTPRQQHWRDIIAQPAGIAHIESLAGSCMPALRLLCTGDADAASLAGSAGIGFATLPAIAVAEWAGSLEQAASELSQWGWASLGSRARDLQRLKPVSAIFVPVNDGALAVDPDRGRDLFRFEDPDIPGHQAYVLGTATKGNPPRYSYIQDSRWGVWLDIHAFAEMARRMCNIGDACPWPVPYKLSACELWLPARLRPPFVIERALTLCSGGPPRSVASTGRPISTLVGLDGAVVGSLSPVYGEMMDGTWLCYRYVPARVAMAVATRLGGTVHPIRD